MESPSDLHPLRIPAIHDVGPDISHFGLNLKILLMDKFFYAYVLYLLIWGVPNMGSDRFSNFSET